MNSKLKITQFLFLFVFICVFSSKAQEINKVFLKNGNIFVQYDNAETRQISNKGIDSYPFLAKDKSYVIFLRTIINSAEPEEGVAIINETKIILYNFSNSVESVLVQGCKPDGTGSSIIDYSDSNEFPFSELCNITNLQISPDGQRLYFETSAWTVSNAIHYCFLPNQKIAFCSSGSLNRVLPDGNLNITITDVEENKGRYLQDWLFDKNGTAIQPVGEKQF